MPQKTSLPCRIVFATFASKSFFMRASRPSDSQLAAVIGTRHRMRPVLSTKMYTFVVDIHEWIAARRGRETCLLKASFKTALNVLPSRTSFSCGSMAIHRDGGLILQKEYALGRYWTETPMHLFPSPLSFRRSAAVEIKIPILLYTRHPTTSIIAQLPSLQA